MKTKGFSYLFNLRNRGSSYGIDRMQRLVPLLSNPHKSFPVVHVAGTNGKGSVCAMLDSIYRENGYKVGLFSSPHLVELGERIKVDGKPLTNRKIEHLINIIRPVADELEEKVPGEGPTFFEFMTIMAFLVFKEQKVDLAIFETGLGGRLDSTNVCQPELTLITTIDRDHCAILGNTIEEIAKEKAGIIKERVPGLCGWLPDEANEVIRRYAASRSAPFESLALNENPYLPETNLFGEYQRRNASMAYRAVQILNENFPVSKPRVLNGLKKVKLEGRWQIIEVKPRLILDACHNREGALALRSNLIQLDQTVVVWMGALGQERARDVLQAVCPFATEIRFFRPNQSRACSFETLKKMIPTEFSGSVNEGSVDSLLDHMKETDKSSTVLITGSIYLIGEILAIFKNSNGPMGANFQDLV